MEKTKSDEVNSIINFLTVNVCKSDIPNVEVELKKDFVLAKVKSKAQRKVAKKKICRTLNRTEKKNIGFLNVPKNMSEECFRNVIVMNKLWLEYINKVLDLQDGVPSVCSKNWDNLVQCLYKADFHGSNLRVTRSKCPSYVGLSGICIMDTRNTFKVVSNDRLVRVIPKKECVFQVYINKYTFTLMGKHFCVRPAERSTKKIKSQLYPDL